MKFRLYLTAGATAIMWSQAFIMNWDPQVGIKIFLVSLVFLAIYVIFTLVWDVFGVIALWPRYRARSFAPLAVLVLAFLLTPTVGQIGFQLRLERFRKQVSRIRESGKGGATQRQDGDE